VFDAGIDNGAPYVVMELLSGPTLEGLLAERGPLPAGLALEYAGQAAAGLAAAHAAGVVHRDIKPANLVLDGDCPLKIVDFGIARLAEAAQALTASGLTLGTPAYLSPEQAAGQPAGPRSDLYALGCVLYALLTGQPPFTGEHPAATVQQHLTAPPPAVGERRPDVPAGTGQLLAALLAKDPQDRPPGAVDVQRWLAQLLPAAPPASQGATFALPAATPQPPRPPDRPVRARRWPLAVAGGAVTALAVALAILALTHTGGGTQAGPPASVPPAPATTSPAPHPSASHHVPVTPAEAVTAVQAAIRKAQHSGALQPQGATDLQHQLSDLSKSIDQGNLQDAGHKVGDLLHHLGDLAHKGQISPRGLAILSRSVTKLANLLPQQP
ncbi:MAG: serine/threonine protein kinase, partial [Nocardiopsaceae bacterium]|jgi:serine/threonine-protein kinase|nr:serine/threonine protein kinase [Nocardiopsaceae bacterium]